MKPQTADALRTISIVALAIGILIFLYRLSLKIDAVTVPTTSLVITANQAMQNLRDAAASARDASEQAKLAATEQRAYWNKTSLEMYKTMAALRLTIVRTDESFNNVLMPKLATSLDASVTLQESAMKDLSDAIGKVDVTIDALRPAIDGGIAATQAASAAMEAAGKTWPIRRFMRRWRMWMAWPGTWTPPAATFAHSSTGRQPLCAEPGM